MGRCGRERSAGHGFGGKAFQGFGLRSTVHPTLEISCYVYHTSQIAYLDRSNITQIENDHDRCSDSSRGIGCSIACGKSNQEKRDSLPTACQVKIGRGAARGSHRSVGSHLAHLPLRHAPLSGRTLSPLSPHRKRIRGDDAVGQSAPRFFDIHSRKRTFGLTKTRPRRSDIRFDCVRRMDTLRARGGALQSVKSRFAFANAHIKREPAMGPTDGSRLWEPPAKSGCPGTHQAWRR